MAYTEGWDENYPDGASQQGFELDDEVRSAKTAIRERLEGDVTLNGVLENFSTTAKPKAGMARVFYDTEANKGTIPLEDGRLFVSTDENRLYSQWAGGQEELPYCHPGDAEEISAPWTWKMGATPTQAIKIEGDEPAAEEQRDSHEIEIATTCKDAILDPHTAKWWIRIQATSTAGTGRLTFDYQKAGGTRYRMLAIAGYGNGEDGWIYSMHSNVHANFNADMVDGKHASDLALASHEHSWADLTSGEVGTDIIPSTNTTYDLGENTTPKWFADAWIETVHTNDVYAATSTLYLRAQSGVGWFIAGTDGDLIPTAASLDIGSSAQPVDNIFVDNIKDVTDIDTSADSDMLIKRNGATRLTLTAAGVAVGGTLTVGSGTATFSGGAVTVSGGGLTVSGGNLTLGTARALNAPNTGADESVIICEDAGVVIAGSQDRSIQVTVGGVTRYIKCWTTS